jgi:hypothetical protein
MVLENNRCFLRRAGGCPRHQFAKSHGGTSLV